MISKRVFSFSVYRLASQYGNLTVFFKELIYLYMYNLKERGFLNISNNEKGGCETIALGKFFSAYTTSPMAYPKIFDE